MRRFLFFVSLLFFSIPSFAADIAAPAIDPYKLVKVDVSKVQAEHIERFMAKDGRKNVRVYGVEYSIDDEDELKVRNGPDIVDVGMPNAKKVFKYRIHRHTKERLFVWFHTADHTSWFGHCGGLYCYDPDGWISDWDQYSFGWVRDVTVYRDRKGKSHLVALAKRGAWFTGVYYLVPSRWWGTGDFKYHRMSYDDFELVQFLKFGGKLYFVAYRRNNGQPVFFKYRGRGHPPIPVTELVGFQSEADRLLGRF